MGQQQAKAVGIEGKSHMKEVYAEDDTMMYRKGLRLITKSDNVDIDAKVAERMRFCCEEKWKTYLRCMEGRSTTYAPECAIQKEAADFCVGRLDKDQLTLGTQKKYVMGFVQSEARVRSAISVSDWRQELSPESEKAPT
eukprot:TRINITY_DN1288_c4_g1_i1.p1 TRINITY_DN1288_c4_g1~~TRINITY_DN1288_c4_g1_i1.p1  ORF type:complete len:154 (+),score=34.33 TRINITY_DN1288_c4_g1_i1:47-463(+)